MGRSLAVIVLDTSVLLYWAFNHAELSRSALLTIQQADAILISSISLWEIALKEKQGKLILPITPRAMAARLHSVYRVQTKPVDDEIWLTSVELPWTHRDPADRVIVATAQTQGCPLVTQDLTIRDFYPAAIW